MNKRVVPINMGRISENNCLTLDLQVKMSNRGPENGQSLYYHKYLKTRLLIKKYGVRQLPPPPRSREIFEVCTCKIESFEISGCKGVTSKNSGVRRGCHSPILMSDNPMEIIPFFETKNGAHHS